MTHEELVALLPPYAAGELEAESALAVRAHLAGGCSACLDELFRRPVGVPLAGPEPSRSRHGRPGLQGSAIAFVVVALAVGVAVAAWWIIDDVRRREAAARAAIADAERRLAERTAAVAALGTRVGALEREVAAARESLDRHTEAELAVTSLQERLDAAGEQIAELVRDVRRRDAELSRLRMGVEERQAVRDLLATPGVEMLALAPVPPFRDVRGHVLWHPARVALVLYAFDLPAPPNGGAYRVRVRLDGVPAAEAPAFRPGPDGEVALPLRLGAPGVALREVVVVRGASEQPVLSGRREPG